MFYRSFFALMVVFLVCVCADMSVLAQSEMPRDPLEAHLWARRQVDPKELTTQHDYTKTVGPGGMIVPKARTKNESQVFRRKADKAVVVQPPVPGSKPGQSVSGGVQAQAQAVLGAPVIPGHKPNGPKVSFSPPPDLRTSRTESRVFTYKEEPRTAGWGRKRKKKVAKVEKVVVQPDRPAVVDEVVAIANSVVKPKVKPVVVEAPERVVSESLKSPAHVPVKPSFKPVRGFNVARSFKSDEKNGQVRAATTEIYSNAISDVRVGNHPGKTRIVFDVKSPPEFSVDVDRSGKALAVVFKDTAMSTDLEHGYRSHALLSGYESYAAGKDIQIMFDLKKSVKVLAHYVLPPSGDQAYHRVVVDIARL